jgi:hypothetical protein
MCKGGCMMAAHHLRHMIKKIPYAEEEVIALVVYGNTYKNGLIILDDPVFV